MRGCGGRAEPAQPSALRPGPSPLPLSRSGYGVRTLKVGGAHLPPPAREASGGEGDSGEARAVGGASPRRFVDDQARCRWVSWPNRRIILVALSPRPASPPLPLPATRLRRAGGGRSEKPTCVNLITRSGEGFAPIPSPAFPGACSEAECDPGRKRKEAAAKRRRIVLPSAVVGSFRNLPRLDGHGRGRSAVA